MKVGERPLSRQEGTRIADADENNATPTALPDATYDGKQPMRNASARHAHATRTTIPSAAAGPAVERPPELAAAEEWIRNNFGDRPVDEEAQQNRMGHSHPDEDRHHGTWIQPKPEPKPEPHSPTLDFIDETTQWANKVCDAGQPVCGATQKEARSILRTLAARAEECVELEDRINEEYELLDRAREELTSIHKTLDWTRTWRHVLQETFMVHLKHSLQHYFTDGACGSIFPLSKQGPVADRPSSSRGGDLEILPPSLDAIEGDEYAPPASTDSEVSLLDTGDDDDDDSSDDRPDGENGRSSGHGRKGKERGDQDEDGGEDEDEDEDDNGDGDGGGDDRYDGGNGGSGGYVEGSGAKNSSGNDDENESIPSR